MVWEHRSSLWMPKKSLIIFFNNLQQLEILNFCFFVFFTATAFSSYVASNSSVFFCFFLFLPQICLTFSENSAVAAVKLYCSTNSRAPLSGCDTLWVCKCEFTTVCCTALTQVVFGSVQVHLTAICKHFQIEKWDLTELTECWPFFFLSLTRLLSVERII